MILHRYASLEGEMFDRNAVLNKARNALHSFRVNPNPCFVAFSLLNSSATY